MAVSSLSGAKTLCHLSGWTLTNLRLQKILYLAHMTHLGRFDGQRLFNEEFEAWMYGPVLPRVYNRAKVFGSSPVCDRFYEAPLLKAQTQEFNLLDEVWQAFKNTSGWELVSMTHSPQGAWAKNYSTFYNAHIPNEDIWTEYKQRTENPS